ncbi:CDCA3 protein, partial [Bucco capensis]|nr:CDCA3 protein [Bucco capensis]
MGVSGSAPATPTAAVPCNKHLVHVSDPRSPSAGILRTPIEVVSSPVGSPQPSPVEPAAGTSQERDPRSPTPGISRTPLRAMLSVSVDRLVKQLSEAFGAEPAPRELEPPGGACPAEEPVRQSSPRAMGGLALSTVPREEAERPPSPSAAPARPVRVPGPGSKPIKRKVNSKVLAASGGTGRSPLSILQDDNSPSAPARQGKRHMLGENLGERKEATVDLSRSLKSGNAPWSDLNKENQQCALVEN